MSIDTTKIIHGVVGGGRYTVTSPIVKEDYGLYLLIEGLELPATYEVDFSNSEHNGTSVTMIGNADGVLIPSQFISSGKDVFAFLYHVGADYGRTVYKFRIPNKLRPDRTNEEPTPEEQSTIDQAISALNTAVAKTAQDVIDADASAQSASADADRAEQAKDDASTFAQRSAQSAQASADYSESAQASATASAQSASQSAQIKDDVEDMVDDAQASASASAQSASASANSASQASGYATSASQSATSAQGYASQAQTSANTASTKASEASTSASTASQKATESAQSATSAQGYAQTAEQAKTASQTAQGLAESARDSAISAKEDAEDARDEAQSIVDGISEKVEQIDSNTERIESLEDDRYKPYPTDTASGAIASFSDGADDIPLKNLVVNIDPVQSGTGDPSPTNVRPISGWNGVKVTRCGKNLSPINANNVSPRSYWGTNWTELIAVLNTLPVGMYTISNKFTVSTLPNSGQVAHGRIYITAMVNGTQRGLTSYSVTNDTSPTVGKVYQESGTFTITEEIRGNINHAYLYCDSTDHSAPSTDKGTYTLTDVQIELGSSATPYEPYNGVDVSVDLGQTVYGGTLNPLTGVLTAYPYYASYNGETLTGRWISDRDVYAVGTTPTIGAQVVNIGAQGTEYQLEPHEVASLFGTNNIFADTGDTSAEYRADTTLYISRLTEPDADMIADSNIVSGQYFMVGNSLYKATANIANGGQITVGTNCTRVSLAQALNEINA